MERGRGEDGDYIKKKEWGEGGEGRSGTGVGSEI